MSIFAISDPHLSFGVPSKSMEIFGSQWADYTEKFEKQWRLFITDEDLVLIPGDISWGMTLEEALVDLCWIAALPGQKIIIKGNHDYWWDSSSKMSKVMPPSIHFIHNTVFNWNDVTIGGTRLWDTEEYNFNEFIHFQDNPKAKEITYDAQKKENDRKIFQRELQRLDASLKQLDPKAKTRIAMTHYPPIGADLKPSKASSILEEHNIQICVFGHLHSVKKNSLPFGEIRGIKYYLTSCDYLDFTPIRIL